MIFEPHLLLQLSEKRDKGQKNIKKCKTIVKPLVKQIVGGRVNTRFTLEGEKSDFYKS